MGAWIETDSLSHIFNIGRRTLMGAWIETWSWASTSARALVAPLWVRGLKHSPPAGMAKITTSHPMGAWIETPPASPSWQMPSCRTLMGAWIETSGTGEVSAGEWSHPYGCVD